MRISSSHSVASNIIGASGLEMLHAIIGHEENPERLADLAKKRLRAKRVQLEEALYGRVTDHHRFLLERSLLETIPGVGCRTAEQLLGELGAEMARFPYAQHISSWAGAYPGNNESAGKR